MKNRLILSMGIMALCMLSCRHRAEDTSDQVRDFPMVELPGVIAGQDGRMEYLALHFWDAFADTSAAWLCDSAHIAGVPLGRIKEKVSMYCALLDGVPVSAVQQSAHRLMDLLEEYQAKYPKSNVFEGVSGMISDYLYNPNSPARNEECYLPFAQRMAQSPCVNDELRGIYEFTYKMCALNRVGEQAADFTFIRPSGKRMRLSDIDTPQLLLLFSNPGCESCGQLISILQENPLVKKALSDGSLAIVNVYIDYEYENWRSYLSNYPDSWINVYDDSHAVREGLLYNIRAIPSLYLLGKDRRVILKDASVEKVLEAVQSAF